MGSVAQAANREAGYPRRQGTPKRWGLGDGGLIWVTLGSAAWAVGDVVGGRAERVGVVHNEGVLKCGS